jgi:hypothetical protein
MGQGRFQMTRAIENIKIKFMQVIFLLILVSSIANAEILIDLNISDSFKEGERIHFDYSINSDENLTISYLSSIVCAHIASYEPAPILINISTNETFNAGYYFLMVDEKFEPQKCTAFVKIIEPTEIIVEKEFDINVSPYLDFGLRACKDEDCQYISKTFIVNDTIFISYSPTLLESDVKARLIKPNGDEQVLDLPVLFIPELIGVYSLNATVYEESYKPAQDVSSFEVFEKEVSIPIIQDCNLNLVCDSNENYKSCPQDCKSGGKDNYCDKVSDGICDPDCTFEEDKDCPKKEIKLVANETKKEEIEIVEEVDKEEEVPKEEIEEGKPIKKVLFGVLIGVGIIILLIFILIVFFRKKKVSPET